MSFSVTTTKAEAQEVIQAAYHAGTLPAQNGISGVYYALVGDKVVRCAIGALFTEDQAHKLEDNTGSEYLMAGDLMRLSMLKVPEKERAWFLDVQDAHDVWAETYYPEKAETKFKELIGL